MYFSGRKSSDDEFLDTDFSGEDLSESEFYDCAFIRCNFSGANLGNSIYENCVFTECNLSNTLVKNTKMVDVAFKDSKLLGVKFYECSSLPFDVSFEGGVLSLCSFADQKMKKARFLKCAVNECFFENAFLESAVFTGSEFSRCSFHNTDLRKADFRGALGYVIDPTANKLKGARFSMPDVVGLLYPFGVKID